MEITSLPVSRYVDEIIVIYVNSVLARRPDAPILLAAFVLEEAWIGRPAPSLQQVPRFVELEDRWRRSTAASKLAVRPPEAEWADRIAFRVLTPCTLCTAIGGAKRTGTMVNPDVVTPVHEDSADVADNPVVRQGLGPGRVEHKARGAPFMVGRKRLGEALQNSGLL